MLISLTSLQLVVSTQNECFMRRARERTSEWRFLHRELHLSSDGRNVGLFSGMARSPDTPGAVLAQSGERGGYGRCCGRYLLGHDLKARLRILFSDSSRAKGAIKATTITGGTSRKKMEEFFWIQLLSSLRYS
jgi:hypothetical protein